MIGYLSNDGGIAIWGAIVFIMSQAFYLMDAYKYSKEWINNASNVDTTYRTNRIDRIAGFLEGR